MISPQQFLAAYFTGAFTVVAILLWQMWRAQRQDDARKQAAFSREREEEARKRNMAVVVAEIKSQWAIDRQRARFAAIRERINRRRVR